MKKMRFRPFFLMAALIILCFSLFSGSAVALAASKVQVRIKSSTSVDAETIQVKANLPKNVYGTYYIYRSTKKSTNYKLIDTFKSTGGSWSSSGGYWYTVGQKNKVVCFADTSRLAGDVYFFDTNLTLNKRYYYRIFFQQSGSTEKIKSNVSSAKTALPAPVMTKCYASANTTVKLYWEKESSVNGYVIYRNEGKGWKRIKTITKATTVSYTDTTAKSGKTYKYMIRSYKKVGSQTVFSGYGDSWIVKTKTPTVSGTYSRGSVYGPSLSSTHLAEVRRVVQSFKDNFITSSMTEYEKAWTAFCYIRANCSYAYRGWQYNYANTAWGALVYGEAQCSGYARGVKALCDAIGIKCYYVHADSKAYNPSHQWNMVRISGKWYILDAQGGFFLVGSDTYRNMVGMSWSTSGLPTCNKADHAQGGFVSSEM